jgi:hypothetical protein
MPLKKLKKTLNTWVYIEGKGRNHEKLHLQAISHITFDKVQNKFNVLHPSYFRHQHQQLRAHLN